MANHNPPPPMESGRLESPSGLSVQVNANGSIRRMDHKDILINLFPGNEVEGGPANLYLRLPGNPVEAVPLLGPRSPAAIRRDRRGLVASGEWRDIRFTVSLVLAESAPAWFWHVRLENTGRAPRTVELIHTQDLGLAPYGAVRLNEYYVSQYLDHAPLAHPERGIVLASRQNLSVGGRNPWAIVGSLRRGTSYATDALQVYGLAARAGRLPPGLAEGLPGFRRQHEHAMAAIQDAPLRLEPGATEVAGFFGGFREDHPAASSDADLVYVDRVLSLPEAAPSWDRNAPEGIAPDANLFGSAPLLDALELTEADLDHLFGGERREEEVVDEALLSFFAGSRRHVALKVKELKVLRPHGHILRTGSGLTPDEAGLTSTVWMAGVFHSMVTQGHVSINRFLSTTHSYLSLFRSHGQRIFVDLAGDWRLLDVPSAFEMMPEGCRWIYKHDDGLIEVRSLAPTDRHELNLAVEVLSGPSVRCLISNHVAINGDDGAEAVPVRYERDEQGVFVRPIAESDVGRRFPGGGFRIDPVPGTGLEQVGGDELLFADGRSRHQPFLCLVTAPATEIGFRMTGCLMAVDATAGEEMSPDRYWTEAVAGTRIEPPAESPLAGNAARLADILPWFAHNALIHYLSPRGLEQYSGGGWGTRDVTQGPVEMLLALGRFEPLRDLLIRVFKAQNADGDWPQWFMFFDRERNIRPSDSHGDIVFWPILALAQYLSATEDASLLEESVPFFHPEGDGKAEWATLWQHVERALTVIGARTIPGTRLAAYGHGDWNDALQPVDPAMRERLCSTWTVTLHYQTLTTLAQALRRLGLDERAAGFEAAAESVLEDFRRLLLVDDLLAGFAYFGGDGRIDYLLHPRDRTTGLAYSLLPMIHAVINGMLTPAQAETHLACIRDRLSAPDGARLFDRPMTYRGGPQRIFQRAESSSFFGREIGLMYTHAHLRYAEALARYGDAEGFFEALCKANPVGLRALVPAATLRQSNGYYSSSDATFADRYRAQAEYDRVRRGEIPLDGGWRIYSSGAGIGMRLILRCFLGLCREKNRLVIDPVIPKSLDGLRIETQLLGRTVEVVYRVDGSGCGPTAVNLNGADLPFDRSANPYRLGAAEVPAAAVSAALADGINRLAVRVA
ncbi:GH36-type glycosyl hydrolase domain-containing protein [Methylocaldum sp. MU1018]